MAASTAPRSIAPPLAAAQWPSADYSRAELPIRIVQFGTGMLLRALVTEAIDHANRSGRGAGRIAVVQSTPSGLAHILARQDGLFTVVARGTVDGRAVERAQLIGAVGETLDATGEWKRLVALICSADVRVIVSNVTEAGLALDATDRDRLAAGDLPSSYPARLALLLAARARALGAAAPSLLIIPTELVDDNGPRLERMVREALTAIDASGTVAAWMGASTRFCSSLVDRITTGAPSDVDRAALVARLGYDDALLTITEPYALWAIEGDPELLREALPIDDATGCVRFAPDIQPMRDRKLRLLNGLHTAIAPIALLTGVETVLDAVQHPELGPFLHRLLMDELVPLAPVAADDARTFAQAVLDRFANPWLEHQWAVIRTNQLGKVRHRLLPTLTDACAAGRAVPCLTAAFGAFLWWANQQPAPQGELARLSALLRSAATAESAVDSALGDPTLWGMTFPADARVRAGISRVYASLAMGRDVHAVLAQRLAA
jgi:tagaturonate reductase